MAQAKSSPRLAKSSPALAMTIKYRVGASAVHTLDGVNISSPLYVSASAEKNLFSIADVRDKVGR